MGFFSRIFYMSIYIVFRYLKTTQTLYYFERRDSQLFPDTKIIEIRLLEIEKSEFETELITYFGLKS